MTWTRRGREERHECGTGGGEISRRGRRTGGSLPESGVYGPLIYRKEGRDGVGHGPPRLRHSPGVEGDDEVKTPRVVLSFTSPTLPSVPSL